MDCPPPPYSSLKRDASAAGLPQNGASMSAKLKNNAGSVKTAKSEIVNLLDSDSDESASDESSGDDKRAPVKPTKQSYGHASPAPAKSELSSCLGLLPSNPTPTKMQAPTLDPTSTKKLKPKPSLPLGGKKPSTSAPKPQADVPTPTAKQDTISMLQAKKAQLEVDIPRQTEELKKARKTLKDVTKSLTDLTEVDRVEREAGKKRTVLESKAAKLFREVGKKKKEWGGVG